MQSIHQIQWTLNKRKAVLYFLLSYYNDRLEWFGVLSFHFVFDGRKSVLLFLFLFGKKKLLNCNRNWQLEHDRFVKMKNRNGFSLSKIWTLEIAWEYQNKKMERINSSLNSILTVQFISVHGSLLQTNKCYNFS